eukprot:3355497-Rhodomonas_salina.1
MRMRAATLARLCVSGARASIQQLRLAAHATACRSRQRDSMKTTFEHARQARESERERVQSGK